MVISKDVIRRNLLETDFWSAFTEANKNLRIVLIVEGGKQQDYVNKYEASNVVVCGTQKENTSLWHKTVLFMVRTGVDSHGVKLYRWRSLTLGKAGYAMTFFKVLIANTLARSCRYKKLVRKLYGGLKLSWIEELFEEYKPDLVFTPSLIDINVDALIGSAAKRRGIRVVGMVRSWDNLAIHGLLPFVPDRFILQNKWLKESAERFQALDMSRIEYDIIGLPHYDLYKDPTQYLKSREEFFAGLGLDPNKKLILLGGFDFYFSEDVLPALLNEAINKGKIREPVQIVFRPHPATPFEMEDYHIDELEHVTLDAAFVDKKKAFSDAEKFINLMYHCDVLINVASTLAIDGAVFDKPVICVNFDDERKKLPYWKSVHRLFDCFDHYERLVATGGVRLPQSFDGLIKDINDYLEDPTLEREGRQRIIDVLVAPFDGRSGKRLSRILTEEVSKL